MSFLLEMRDGSTRELPVHRWHGSATPEELALVGSLAGPVLDVGCGPGRIAAALSEAGTPALGIDIAPAAVRCASESGAAALCRSVFDPVPGEGRWASLVLLDGNVGIGGDPTALLLRCAQLGRDGATLVVEVDPPGVPGRHTEARIHPRESGPGPWFPWSVVSAGDIGALAAGAGAELVSLDERAGRHFAELVLHRRFPAPLRESTVAVIAKAPEPGRVKTRLCPPCTDTQAAEVAAAALADTLRAVGAAGVHRRALVLDGEAGPWVPPGTELYRQCGGGLGERLQDLFEQVVANGAGGGRGDRRAALVVGMDTPQVAARDLEDALGTLGAGGADAVLGPSLDGGYWTIGFTAEVFERGLRPFEGVPMSSEQTAEAQLRRLEALGLRVSTVRSHRDVDHWDDALAVAAAHPHLTTSAVVASIGATMPGASVAASSSTGEAGDRDG